MEADGADPGGVVPAAVRADRAGDLFPARTDLPLKDTLSLDEIAARFTSGGSATHEKKAPAVRMVWRSGEKSIAMDEITGIFLVDPDGRTVEITGQIKDIAGEAFKNE